MNEHDLYRVMQDIDRKYTDEAHRYAAEIVTTKRRRGNMKQKAKTKAPSAQMNPWKIGISAAVTACAVIAASIGAGIISMDKQQQMQVGMSGGTSVAEQLSENEPILIRNNCTEGVALAMDIPAEGTAEVLHSVEDAEPWITLLQQNAENGGEDGAGYSPALEMLKLEAQYQHYDVIFVAVPYHWLTPDSGITAHNFMGGTITKDGRLTVKAGFERVGEGLRPLVQPEIETFCCCFAVPKGSVPEITDFAFEDVFFDCTDPLPDDVLTQGDMGEYLCSLPQHQEYSKMLGEEKYLYWADDETQTADAMHEPVEIIDKLVVSGGNDSTMMKLPPEGAVQVLRSVEDAEACCQYSDENVAGQPFDFRKKLTEDVFAEYDVLYFAFKDEQQPQYCYSVDLAGGSIAEDGTTLKLNFHALMFDPEYLPAHWCSTTEPDWNTYYFYTVPKDSLPDLYAIELSFEEYPIGEIPDDILKYANDTSDSENAAKLPEYVQTTQAYLDWEKSIPEQRYITWGKSKPVLPDGCEEVQSVDAAHEPVLLTELLSFSATDEMAIKVPNSGIAEIWHSMNDAAQIMQSDVVNFEEYFSEDVLAEYDVLYLAHPLAILPENLFRFHPSSGTFLTNGALQINLAALSLSELPEGWSSDPDRLNSVNHYWFYTVPKNTLPEIGKWEYDVTDYQIGELPENAKDVRGGGSAFMEYLLTTKAYQGWENAIGATMYITWEKSESVLPEGCIEVKTEAADENR